MPSEKCLKATTVISLGVGAVGVITTALAVPMVSLPAFVVGVAAYLTGMTTAVTAYHTEASTEGDAGERPAESLTEVNESYNAELSEAAAQTAALVDSQVVPPVERRQAVLQ